MPIVMIVLFSVAVGSGGASLPAAVSLEFPSAETCMRVAADLYTRMSGAGVCLNRTTGQTFFWGLTESAEDDGNPAQTPFEQ